MNSKKYLKNMIKDADEKLQGLKINTSMAVNAQKRKTSGFKNDFKR